MGALYRGVKVNVLSSLFLSGTSLSFAGLGTLGQPFFVMGGETKGSGLVP